MLCLAVRHHFWVDVTLEKSEHGRMSHVVSGMVKITKYFSRIFIDLINISSFAGENSIVFLIVETITLLMNFEIIF